MQIMVDIDRKSTVGKLYLVLETTFCGHEKKQTIFSKPQFFCVRNEDKSDLTSRRGRKGARILFIHCGLLGLMDQDSKIPELIEREI